MSEQLPSRFAGNAVDLSHLVANGRGSVPPAGPATGATAGGGQVVDVPALVISVTDESFEQIAQLSAVVPVVFDLGSPRSEASAAFSALLEKVVRELGGRALLGRVDVDANPGLAQAFQAQAIPSAVALVGGRPVPLFQGAVPEDQLREILAQLVQLAVQQGVTGRVNAAEEAASEEPAEPPLNPAHEAALQAVDRGDFAAAVSEYERVLAKAPADHEARAALVQVRLLARLQHADAEEIRAAAAAEPENVDAQLAVADLDVSGGHVEDAFLRLLELFASSGAEERTRVRERLLELFEVVGVTDPRVNAARARLASLLY